MLILAPENKFSSSYSRARTRFLAAAGEAGAKLSQFSAGYGGETVEGQATDIAWFGTDCPKKAVLIVSGVHGVEGFAGSAVQLAALDYLPELPGDMALVMVHVLNPYGMQNLRRVNANNVDLNRNFLFNKDDFVRTSEAYATLDAFLNPSCPPSSWEFFSLKLWLKQFRCGKAAMTQAVAGGQYQFPRGLFYGGQCMEPEALAYKAWLSESPLANVEQLLVLDLHTGLGALGVQTLFLRSDTISHTELGRQLRLQVLPDGSSAGEISYAHDGGASGLYRKLLPETKLVCLTVEYGTYSSGHILQALRAENQYYHYGDGQRDHWSKRKLKQAFCPEPDIWRKQVVIQGIELISRAVDCLRT